MTDLEWFYRKYVQHLTASGNNSLSAEEARQWVTDQYIAGLASGRIDRVVESDEDVARRMFNIAVMPRRKTARQELLRTLDELYDVRKGRNLLGDVDPILDRVFPIGSSDGRDKVLRYWTRDDFVTARKVREVNRDDVNRQTDDYGDMDDKWAVEWASEPETFYFGELFRNVKRQQPPTGS